VDRRRPAHLPLSLLLVTYSKRYHLTAVLHTYPHIGTFQQLEHISPGAEVACDSQFTSPVSDIEHLVRQHIRADTARQCRHWLTTLTALRPPSRTPRRLVCVWSSVAPRHSDVTLPVNHVDHLSVQLLQARPTHDARQLRHTFVDRCYSQSTAQLCNMHTYHCPTQQQHQPTQGIR